MKQILELDKDDTPMNMVDKVNDLLEKWGLEFVWDDSLQGEDVVRFELEER